jgi:hypothetical protein
MVRCKDIGKLLGLIILVLLSGQLEAQDRVDTDLLTQKILQKVEKRLDLEIERILCEVEGVLDDCVLGKWRLGDNPRKIKEGTKDEVRLELKANIMKRVRKRLLAKKGEIMQGIEQILIDCLEGEGSDKEEKEEK